MSDVKVVICCPGNSFSARFVGCLGRLIKHFDTQGYEYRFSTAYSRNIYEARNKCLVADPTQGANQQPFNGWPYTHILWIDDDITFTADDFDLLLQADKDVVSGFYIMADAQNYACVKVWDEKYFAEHGNFEFMTPDDIKDGRRPTRVEYTGFGWMLIRSGVFEKIGYPWFDARYLEIGDACDISMEDVSFCLKCKDQKIPVFAHPKVIVGHNKTLELKL